MMKKTMLALFFTFAISADAHAVGIREWFCDHTGGVWISGATRPFCFRSASTKAMNNVAGRLTADKISKAELTNPRNEVKLPSEVQMLKKYYEVKSGQLYSY